MANRNFPSSRLFGFHMMPVKLNCSISFGASGAPTISGNSSGIASVTQLATGIYQLQLQDNYPSFLNVDFSIGSPKTGSDINPNAFDTSTLYQITIVGTTDWHALGLPAGITPAVGAVLVPTGTGSGTGRAKVVGASNIISVQTPVNHTAMLNNQPATPLLGSYLIFTTWAATDASTTTLKLADPTPTSTIYVSLFMNNSSVQ